MFAPLVAPFDESLTRPMLLSPCPFARVPCRLLLLTAILTVGFPVTQPLLAHDWPDGIVDRSIQCDVWPDRIELRIGVGMSNWTVENLLLRRLSSPAKLAETPEQRITQIRELLLLEFAERLELTVDGQPVKLRPVASELSSVHHVLFYLELSGEYRLTRQPAELLLLDPLFDEWRNQIRLAVRPRRTALLQANVEPLIVRAERRLLWELSPDAASAARRIQAFVALPGGPGLDELQARRRAAKIAAAKAASRVEPPDPSRPSTGEEVESPLGLPKETPTKLPSTEPLDELPPAGDEQSKEPQTEPYAGISLPQVALILLGIALVATGLFTTVLRKTKAT